MRRLTTLKRFALILVALPLLCGFAEVSPRAEPLPEPAKIPEVPGVEAVPESVESKHASPPPTYVLDTPHESQVEDLQRREALLEQTSESLDRIIAVMGNVGQQVDILVALTTLIITVILTLGVALGIFEFRKWSALRREVAQYADTLKVMRDNALSARDRLRRDLRGLRARLTDTPSREVKEKTDEMGKALMLLELIGTPLTAADYENKSIDLFYKGRIEDSLDAIEQAIRIEPSAEFWNEKSFILHKLGRYEEALRSAREAVRLDEYLGKAWDNIGCNLRRLGLIDEGLAACERAVQLAPSTDEVWYNRACLLMAKGEKDRALADLREAIRREPKNRSYAKADSDFRPLRNDEAFKELISGQKRKAPPEEVSQGT